MKTYKDSEEDDAVVHAVVLVGEWQNRLGLLCGASAVLHPGDVYHVHQRPLTCVACAARHHDVG